MKKRVFISLDLPLEIQRKIKIVQDKLPDFLGKKIEPWNLHLTLKFIGEIEEKQVEEITKKLKEVNIKPFEIEIEKVGVFSENFIRIIWLSVKNCEQIQAEIDQRLSSFYPIEKRFMGHLTIARVKTIKDKASFLENLNRIKIPKIIFPVTNFRLKESIMQEEGPVYKTLEEYNLN
ncbi:RNA 2',3'-cyclic phosphodiesterase [Patescibacteria group bacterium]|nr:RNA 2',3'-cyclic phosphodiesterase [Patescibacteria group bacterium]